MKAKKAFQADVFLTFFNPDLPLIVVSDASNDGCGAVLSHILPDGSEKPIKHISHLFTETQQKYSMIDNEAFGIVYAIKNFHQYC